MLKFSQTIFQQKIIFHEPYLEWLEHKIIFFKLASKYQIILLFHDFISFFINCFHSFIYFFIKPEFYKHHFNRVENSKWQRQDISFKHLLFTVWFTVARKLFCKIMQHMFLRKSELPRDLSCGLSFWGITVMFQTK